VVPVTFAVTLDEIYFAVDHKPKSGRRLQRLVNIAAEPRVSLLVDHYDQDWRQLWWVRADATAQVLPAGDAQERALDLLVAKYPQYVTRRPSGPVVRCLVTRWRGWSGGAASL
jgi:PPOX class probable F420-dependent enzyme